MKSDDARPMIRARAHTNRQHNNTCVPVFDILYTLLRLSARTVRPIFLRACVYVARPLCETVKRIVEPNEITGRPVCPLRAVE